ncbi:alpha/beta fold hydrolase [Streptacidiphilus rugosus]|uniref:alpha/beta fold hydrolase n=1 Tax=Streptacidiphilus rugosus TaxID=405783 RepID=UPI00056B7B79|nr:alpha/beta hydrolase [Streptacidiphilus rugosus]
MRLNTREWGSGDKVALLVHGIMSDSRTWRLVGPALAERGYRVIAVDQRGHGASGRGEYTPENYADDLVETLPGGAALAIGHSLGGLTLSLAVDRLKPERAVFSDPAWRLVQPEQGFDPAMFVEFAAHATRESIAATNPRWAEEDVQVELETLAVWDGATALALSSLTEAAVLPQKPVVPSLVQVADPSFLLSAEDKETLRGRGFEVRTVEGAGHTIHRDDFAGFMASLDGWI